MYLGGRIKMIRGKFLIETQEDLSNILDIDVQRIRNLETGRVKHMLVEEATKFEVILKVNPWWLLSGEGKMLLSDNSSVETIFTQAEYQISLLTTENTSKIVGLDKYFFADKTKIQNNLRATKMLGDSMYPTLNNGDGVVIDISKNGSTDGIYAIYVENNYFIKRLAFLLDGTIEILSDNQKYKKQFTSKEAIKIIGMVILIIKNC